jgi:hypothetical protein
MAKRHRAASFPPLTAEEVEVVRYLVNPDLLSGFHTPSIAAALREARMIVGRNQRTGEVLEPDRQVAWSGALMYLIFCEQIGSCFHVGKRGSKSEPLKNALTQFGGFERDDARSLGKLRDRLAHDFTLSKPNDPVRLRLDGEPSEPVVTHLGHEDQIRLPALANRIEGPFRDAFDQALEDGSLRCHYPGGVEMVYYRFSMMVVPPRPWGGGGAPGQPIPEHLRKD